MKRILQRRAHIFAGRDQIYEQQPLLVRGNSLSPRKGNIALRKLPISSVGDKAFPCHETHSQLGGKLFPKMSGMLAYYVRKLLGSATRGDEKGLRHFSSQEESRSDENCQHFPRKLEEPVFILAFTIVLLPFCQKVYSNFLDSTRVKEDHCRPSNTMVLWITKRSVRVCGTSS